MITSNLVVAVFLLCTFCFSFGIQESTTGSTLSRIRCYSGIKTTSGELDDDERKVMRCDEDYSCLSVSATISQDQEEMVIESGRCVPSSKCRNYTCESVFSFLPDVAVIADCEISCCGEDMCNMPDGEVTEELVNHKEDSCPPNSWTAWFNSDTDASDGDFETMPTLRAYYPNSICEQPTTFQALNTRTLEPYDGSLYNVLVSKETGLECLSFPGLPCDDYKIRFCCPEVTRLKCYTGTKTSGPGFNHNEQKVEQCPVGMLCADITAEVVFDPGNNFTSLESVGFCLLSETCSNIGCDNMVTDMLPSATNLDILSGECRCCDEDLCNTPHETYVATKVEANEAVSSGIMCFTGVDVNQNVSSDDVLLLDLKQCDSGQVCSDLEANIMFADQSQPSMRFHQAQCLSPNDCESRNCDYISSLLLPDLIKMENIKCKVSCCSHDRCNDPTASLSHIPDVAPTPEVSLTKAETTGSVFQSTRGTTTTILTTTTQIEVTPPPLPTTTQEESPSFFLEDLAFLPSCSASNVVMSVFRCERVFASPIIYQGPMDCRSGVGKAIACVRSEIAQCMVGGGRNVLDSLGLPFFNSKNISLLLDGLASHSDDTLEANINRFCFHASMNFPYPYPVDASIDGCEDNVLNKLLRKTTTFYNKYAWARDRTDICRAFQQLKQWFLQSARTSCNFSKLWEVGYDKNTASYLATLTRVVLNTIEKLNSAAC